jgi:hypothetical protein
MSGLVLYNYGVSFKNMQQHILGFVTSLKNNRFFSTMFITIWSQKLLCSCKGHQDAMWHHGFATIVNITTCSIFG